MTRNHRLAFNALKKLGVPVREFNYNGEDKFWISAEEPDSYKFCDYYAYMREDWEFGVSPVITETLRKYGLFAEWQNPAQLNVWEG